jgi:hypothetical protein
MRYVKTFLEERRLDGDAWTPPEPASLMWQADAWIAEMSRKGQPVVMTRQDVRCFRPSAGLVFAEMTAVYLGPGAGQAVVARPEPDAAAYRAFARDLRETGTLLPGARVLLAGPSLIAVLGVGQSVCKAKFRFENLPPEGVPVFLVGSNRQVRQDRLQRRPSKLHLDSGDRVKRSTAGVPKCFEL